MITLSCVLPSLRMTIPIGNAPVWMAALIRIGVVPSSSATSFALTVFLLAFTLALLSFSLYNGTLLCLSYFGSMCRLYSNILELSTLISKEFQIFFAIKKPPPKREGKEESPGGRDHRERFPLLQCSMSCLLYFLRGRREIGRVCQNNMIQYIWG